VVQVDLVDQDLYLQEVVAVVVAVVVIVHLHHLVVVHFMKLEEMEVLGKETVLVVVAVVQEILQEVEVAAVVPIHLVVQEVQDQPVQVD
jgi:hypothetical protein